MLIHGGTRKIFLVLVVLLAGCGKGVNFGIAARSQSFTQKGNIENNQIDVLWVVDNSGSMAPLQANMVSNFSSFIGNFQSHGYDFHMAVTGTDAYKANKAFNGYTSANASLSLFQDGGNNGAAATGVFVLLPTTPNLNNVFVNNATTGINGSGDERAFSSMMTALYDTNNPAFLRPNSFFAIIILSDEDDFSFYNRTESSWGKTAALDHCYVNPAMDALASTPYGTSNGTVDHVKTCANQTPPDSVASYEAALDTLTQTTGGTRRWNVSAITVLDNNCQAQHSNNNDPNAAAYVSVIGQRYMQMAADTQGITGSVCDASYANSLSAISAQITVLSTQFYLDRIPQISTLSVQVNGRTIPNSSDDGWTYNSAANAIQFHGDATPPQSATINVFYTPVAIGS